MLGFLSREKDDIKKVRKEEISFVSIPNTFTKEEIKSEFLSRAKLFADFLNLEVVYLHFGKDIIIYDFKV